MIIDISSYNGTIDFKELATEQIERIILRGTTKNGNLDTKLLENVDGICKELSNDIFIDVYKFSYARDYGSAAAECMELISKLKSANVLHLFHTLWLDLEDFDGRSHTTQECAQIIAAYAQICRLFDVNFGVYCNYNYLKNIVPKWANMFPIWLARYNSVMGDPLGFNIEMWQYTSKGSVKGISGNVDISKYIRGGNI